MERRGTRAREIPREVFKEFKDACDHFFEQRRNNTAKWKANSRNLRLKEDVCTDLEAHASAHTGTRHLVGTAGQVQFHRLCAKKDINAIRTRYHEAVTFINSIPHHRRRKRKDHARKSTDELRSDPWRAKIFKRAGHPQEDQQVENDIALWKTTLILRPSKNADKSKTNSTTRSAKPPTTSNN